MEIYDLKVNFHWSKTEEGDIVFEYILSENQRFGFMFCKDEVGGWWYLTKDEKGLSGAHDEEFPQELLDELKKLFNS